ncbi:unnamed protein product [Protopolystoma xenopodis]|uniref:Uncharacterized protein n=1 Tax=Protopolystoma xenopodis TaxID=117903 RepID=A0A448WBH7_9PLAT|nr:unnamed protein product [Protopolystoma xenopodis]
MVTCSCLCIQAHVSIYVGGQIVVSRAFNLNYPTPFDFIIKMVRSCQPTAAECPYSVVSCNGRVCSSQQLFLSSPLGVPNSNVLKGQMISHLANFSLNSAQTTTPLSVMIRHATTLDLFLLYFCPTLSSSFLVLRASKKYRSCA